MMNKLVLATSLWLIAVPLLTTADIYTPEGKMIDMHIPRVDIFYTKHGVVFNHKLHREVLKIGCTVCHEELNSPIKNFGEKWAHKVCIGCHAGTSGRAPSNCNGCHKI